MKYLEYIKFSGNQCLDIDFKPKYSTRVIMDVELSGVTNNLFAFFGARDTNSATAANQFVAWMDGSGTRIRSDYFGTSVTANVTLDYTRFIVDMNRNLCTANGITATNTAVTSGVCSYNMFIGAVNNLGAHAYGMHGKVYSCKIYDNNVLVRDLIPAEDIYGVAGMWDRVEQRFFWNVGGETIKAGPVKSIGVISHLFTGLENNKTYYARVFTVNPKGRVNNRVDLPWASAIPTVGIPLSTLPDGTVVMLPENGVRVPFYIAVHNYESDLNIAGRTLMVRKCVHSNRQWSSSGNDFASSASVATWLNGDYLALFDEKMKQLIGTTTFEYSVRDGTYAFTKKTLTKAVFMLSGTELNRQYTGGYNSTDGVLLPTADLLAKNTTDDSGAAATQWTRTIYNYGETSQRYAIAVTTAGAAERPTVSSSRGIRPTFTLPADCLVEGNPNPDGSYNLIV